MCPIAHASEQRLPEELSALLDASVDGVIVIDHAGHILAFSRAAERLFGYTADDVLGKSVNIIMAESDCGAHDDHLARYVATGVPRVIGKGREVEARGKDGTVFPIYLSVGVLPGAPPRFVGFVRELTSHHDVEEKLRLQQHLLHLSRLATVGEMAATIGHELNQPLAAMVNYAQACDRLLLSTDPDIDEIRSALREIVSQSVRTADIMRPLRNLAGAGGAQRGPTSVDSVISEIKDLLHAEVKCYPRERQTRSAATVHSAPDDPAYRYRPWPPDEPRDRPGTLRSERKEGTPQVFVVDDDEAVRDSIKLLLKSIGLSVLTLGSAQEFLATYDSSQPGAVVLDARITGMSGLELQQQLNIRGAVIPVIFISEHDDIPMAVAAMQQGAFDFLQRPFRDQELIDRIQRALAKDRAKRAELAQRRRNRKCWDSLTPRERNVLELMASGKANKVMAADLGLSQRTVESHRARVMEKMRASSLAQLVQIMTHLDGAEAP